MDWADADQLGFIANSVRFGGLKAACGQGVLVLLLGLIIACGTDPSTIDANPNGSDINVVRDGQGTDLDGDEGASEVDAPGEVGTDGEPSDLNTSDSGATDTGASDPGASDPGANDPGTNDPGTPDEGSNDPGTPDPGPAPCVPDCSGKQCGFNGCDGSCGSCSQSELCTVDGQCEAISPEYPYMVFEPAAPAAGQALTVTVYDDTPWAYIGLTVSGPCGDAAADHVGGDSTGGGAWYWTFETSALTGGVYTFMFTAEQGATAVHNTALFVAGGTNCQLCPEVGLSCSDVYPEQQQCSQNGTTTEVTCYKFGHCMGVGDGTQCSWDAALGSYCTDPCTGAGPAQICPQDGVACTDVYSTVLECTATGTSATVMCTKHGFCDGVGDGSHCSWGDGSYCGDPCAGSSNASDPPSGNRFGMGLVGPGLGTRLDLVKELVGNNGYVLMILPGIHQNTNGPTAEWVAAVQQAYDLNLIPVLRLGPSWGNMNIRDESNDAAHHDYSTLAQAYRSVVEGLPKRDNWPMYIQVHNEPNLCHEWRCTGGGTIDSVTTATEYAHFLADVADALHAIGDPRISVSLGALAPGGNVSCECEPCANSPHCTGQGGDIGLDFMQYMAAAVPDIWTRLDYLASHSYPATNTGFGFFQPFEQAQTGLYYFEQELALLQMSLPVLITETGWCTNCPDDGPTWSEEQKSQWTQQAYTNVWLQHPLIEGVMPFVLQDADWGYFGFVWVHTDGWHFPVFDAVRNLRISLGIGL